MCVCVGGGPVWGGVWGTCVCVCVCMCVGGCVRACGWWICWGEVGYGGACVCVRVGMRAYV